MGTSEKTKIQTLMQERKALEGKIQVLQGDLQGRQLQAREIFEIRPHRTFTVVLKGVTVEDIGNLKATAIKGA